MHTGDVPCAFPVEQPIKRGDDMARRAKRVKGTADAVERAAVERERFHRRQVRRAARPTPEWVLKRVEAWAGRQYIGKPSRVPPVAGLSGAQKAENRRIRRERPVAIHGSGRPGRTAPSYD